MKWYRSLNPKISGYVNEILHLEAPSAHQLEEVPELARDFGIEMLELDDADREELEAAVEELERLMVEADPRPKFLRMNDDVELAPRLREFYEGGDHARQQHRFLEGTAYAPYRLYVDFDQIGSLINPDFLDETIGEQYIVFANLMESPESEPSECYAHLAIDPVATTVYLVEPSGDPELIAEDLDAFIARLRQA